MYLVTGEWLLVGDVKARVNTPSRPELVPRQYGMYWSCWSYPNLHGGKASGNIFAINLVWFNLYSAIAYRIAGKFGGQKIWRIVLEVEKIKIWRNLNLANSCDVLSRIHKHAHISMRFW